MHQPAPAMPGAIAPGSLLLGYLAVLVAAEVAVSFVNPLLVFALHGTLVALVLLAIALLGGRLEWRGMYEGRAAGSVEPSGAVPTSGQIDNMALQRVTNVHPIAAALLLPPTIRLISLTLPLAQLDPISRYAAAGLPMLIGAILVARASGISLRALVVGRRTVLLQLLVILVSLGLGAIEFLILRPEAISPPIWVPAGMVAAAAILLGTGPPEELIFRGILQTALRPVLGRWTVIYTAAMFAALHVGYASATDLAFVFAVGLLYGVIFERTRSIVGISLGHGLANVVLIVVMPYVFALSGGPLP